ncbi:alpha/beta fold hydrolase [Moritella sp. Urea-trap-13]|uniref:alpha/beta fold hydrolase n=1 Tax=Moritella sp. Urea-trap-13 TaxID=2058327 RepID=UPI000C34F6C2|nr:alpha/beta hydrolase [Moritella sp. Urea-trap-13]PKH06008.1 alpha/beta hydrolase [Moritella sp. Urea-trap-13]
MNKLKYFLTILLIGLFTTSALAGNNSPAKALDRKITNPDDPSQFNHQFAQVNGIKMHYVDEGEGPAIVLLHGFPLSWYSWRNQIPALVDAGYRVIVPTQRGYGQTESPENIEDYDITTLSGDIVGLLNTLKIDNAVIAGWDWGSPVAWTTALVRPDLISGLVMISSPYGPRGDELPSDVWEKRFRANGAVFYQDYFQTPGVEDSDYKDSAYAMRFTLNSLSASAGPDERGGFILKPGETMLDQMVEPKKLPEWLTPQVLDYYVGEFSSFTGPLNWYRAVDQGWKNTSFLAGAKIQQPALFIAGEQDPGIIYGKAVYDKLEENVPNLYKNVLIPDASHLTPEETPEAVNELLIDFLKHVK